MKKKYLTAAEQAENLTRAHRKGLVPKTNVISTKKVTKHTNRRGNTLTFVS
jgi:hypothetical protein